MFRPHILKLPTKISQFRIIEHEPMKITLKEPYRIRNRNYKNIDYSVLKQLIFDNPLSISTFQESDPNIIATNIVKIINQALDIVAPLKSIKINQKNNDKTKYSDETVLLIIKKKTLLNQYKESKNIEDYRYYRNVSNKCEKNKRKDRLNNIRHEFLNCNTPQEAWKKAKKHMNYSTSGAPTFLIDKNRNEMIRGGKKISQALNCHYITKIRLLKQSIKPRTKDPMLIYKEKIKGYKNQFGFKEINIQELRYAISKLKRTNSTGSQGISIVTIKHCLLVLEQLLLHLVNKVTETEEFPTILKLSKIIPILKPGKIRNEMDSYHPVNLLSPVSKIIEKCWLLQMLKYLEEKKIIPQQHHGGIKNKSTITAGQRYKNQLLPI